MYLRGLTARFWVVPGLIVVASALLAIAMTQLDRLYFDEIERNVPWLFTGTPDAARTILSTIAAAVITIVSISFSLTIVALQQAATQYSTRVLRTFTSNLGNQIVLGVYLGTFMYALIVLRAVRTETDVTGGFVPQIAVSIAIIMATAGIGVLIYFINHIARSIQVATVIDQIQQQFKLQLRDLYPDEAEEGTKDPRPARDIRADKGQNPDIYQVRAKKEGFVSEISENPLRGAREASKRWVYLAAKVGDFVPAGAVLAEIGPRYRPDDDDGDLERRVQNTFDIKAHPSETQDLLFVIRQLVDIALKSLSPGINDMTSAEYAIYYLGDGLRRLGCRAFPENCGTLENGLEVIATRPEWDTFVDRAFSQIRHESSGKISVTRTLANSLSMILGSVPEERRPPVRRQLELLRAEVEAAKFIEADRKELLGLIDSLLKNPRGRQLPHRA